MRKPLSFVLAAIMALSLIGCGKTETEQPVSTTAQTDTTAAPETAPIQTTEVTQSPDKEQATVYIGDQKSGFREYSVPMEGELTGEKLIAGIADITGWNLELNDFFSGKGGMTVSFTPGCSLFTGPPAQQKEEFMALDNYTLARMILDSVQETLRRNFVMEPGDPENLDIWFCVGEDPITIEDITIPLEEPYDGNKIFG